MKTLLDGIYKILTMTQSYLEIKVPSIRYKG